MGFSYLRAFGASRGNGKRNEDDGTMIAKKGKELWLVGKEPSYGSVLDHMLQGLMRVPFVIGLLSGVLLYKTER